MVHVLVLLNLKTVIKEAVGRSGSRAEVSYQILMYMVIQKIRLFSRSKEMDMTIAMNSHLTSQEH